MAQATHALSECVAGYQYDAAGSFAELNVCALPNTTAGRTLALKL